MGRGRHAFAMRDLQGSSGIPGTAASMRDPGTIRSPRRHQHTVAIIRIARLWPGAGGSRPKLPLRVHYADRSEFCDRQPRSLSSEFPGPLSPVPTPRGFRHRMRRRVCRARPDWAAIHRGLNWGARCPGRRGATARRRAGDTGSARPSKRRVR